MTFTYWIQNSDISIAEEGDISSTDHALSLFDNYDWQTQLNIQSELSLQTNMDNCPAGIGFVRQKNIFLHLCPNGDETVLSSCCLLTDAKILGLFKTRKIVLYEASAMPNDVARSAITKFLTRDDDWLIHCFKEND